MQLINGVNVTVLMGGEVLKVDSDGYVGQLTPGTAEIQCRIVPGFDMRGFTVDGKKNLAMSQDVGKDAVPPVSEPHYRVRIPIKTDQRGVYHTEYPNNNIRLLHLMSSGNFCIWEIGLVSQGGYFSRTIQSTWEAQCFRDGQHVVCPFFREEPHVWVQMEEKLADLYADQIENLRPVSEYKQTPLSVAVSNGLEHRTGRVAWFNFAQGFGMLITPEGVARMHWKNVVPREYGSFFPEPGDVVRFAGLREPELTKARATSFKLEAYGLERIS